MSTTIHFSEYYSGFAGVDEITKDIVTKLTANGYFTRVFPENHLLYNGSGTVVLEPTNKVDILRGEEDDRSTWRLAFTANPSETDGGTIHVNVATPLQIRDDGTIAALTGAWESAVTPGRINNWVDRSRMKGTNATSAYPMSYCLTISDHGIFLGVWDQAFDEFQDERKNISPSFRWLLVQRPVDNKTGEVFTTGRAPVFCAYTIITNGLIKAGPEFLPFGRTSSSGSSAQEWNESLTPTQKAYMLGESGAAQIVQGDFKHFLRPVDLAQFHFKFVVCEEDVNRPTLTRPADVSMPDSNPILNSDQLVAVSEDNKYVITIPKGLNTPRFAYTHELDLIAYTSADVIGQFTEVDLPLYESMYRYKALPANRLKNTGMRLLYRITDPEPEETTTIEPETTTTNEPDPEG